jgi:hypothetical protein
MEETYLKICKLKTWNGNNLCKDFDNFTEFINTDHFKQPRLLQELGKHQWEDHTGLNNLSRQHSEN